MNEYIERYNAAAGQISRKAVVIEMLARITELENELTLAKTALRAISGDGHYGKISLHEAQQIATRFLDKET